MRPLPLLPLLLALLAGCAASARPAAPPEIPASRLDALVRASGFAPELTHYDRAIAALRAVEATWNARARAADIAADRVAAAHAFDAARAGLARIAARARQQRADENATLAAVSVSGAPSPSVASARFRRAVLANEARAVAQARQDATQRYDDAVAERRRQLDEREADLAYALTRRDALPAMLARIRENDLGAMSVTRTAAQRRFAALEAREDAQLSAARARDARTLAAYAAQVARETSAQEASTIADIRRATSADLAAPATARAGGPPDLAPAVAQLRDSQSAAFGEATALEGRFASAARTTGATAAALARTDAAAARAAAAQIAALQAERHAFEEAAARYALARGEGGVLRTNAPR